MIGYLSSNRGLLAAVALYGSLLLFLPTAQAQSPPLIPSRADQAAQQQVSLSADSILVMLRHDPVLLLDVKRVLVKTAYEQGRLLDPDDLTDEALFRLIRNDENVRVLATQQIIRSQQRAALMHAPAQPSAPTAQQRTTLPSGAPPTSTPPIAQKAQATLPVESSDSENAPMLPITADEISEVLAQNPAAIQTALLSSNDEPGPDNNEVMAKLRSSLAPRPSDKDSTMAGNAADLPPVAASHDVAVRGPTQKIEKSQIGASPGKPTISSTRPRLQEQPNPYADVPSLYDLYEQVAGKPLVLERFGMDIFRNGTGNFENLPMDLPVGPDYILGPGDGVKIDLWGSVSQRLQRVVDREGRMELPEVGDVMVAGENLGQVQHQVQAVLRTQYRDVQSDVSIARIRSVRVYVVGDIQKPGAYDISSLSTPLNAVYAAGGPTDQGSLRILRHYRGKQLVQEVDVYDLLLHGVTTEIMPMDSGDTILVSPVGPQITIQGMVRRPAIYELRGETTLAQALELAGGVLPTGTLREINVERLEAHKGHSALRLDIPETNDAAAVNKVLAEFKVQDGDNIRISPILPYNNQTVFLQGHVFHPGKYAYREGMKVSDLTRGYTDLLPEPSRQHAEVIRLQTPDFTPEVIAFNLGAALDGAGDQDMVLKPFDTVRVFGRYDFEDPPVITINGEVREPGDHRTSGETHLRDAIYMAGGLTPDAQVNDAQVFRRTRDGGLKVIDISLKKALNGDPTNNVLLEPRDRVFIHRNLERIDPPAVYIKGEVANPGKYPLGEEMTASELVRLAGGFKRSAFTQTADLSRYPVQNGIRIVGDHQEVAIAKALSGDADADITLHNGDVLTIRQVAGWRDIGAALTIEGEVVHPGTYGIREGEHLSSVILRAGGFRASAYPQGAVFEREQVREIAEKNRERLIMRIQSGEGINLSKGTMFAAATGGESEQGQLITTLLRQRQDALTNLKNQSASGRMVIHISADVRSWANTPGDLEVRAGDTLFIPKRPNFVIVTGQVNNATALTYTPGHNAAWYLAQSGGISGLANKKGIYIVRANGSVLADTGGRMELWKGNVLNSAMQPGDTIVVPERLSGGSTQLKSLLSAAQMMSSLAIAARVATSF